jgi:hypothetical protein
VTKVAATIRQVDHEAVILAPAIAGGGNGLNWVAATLDARGMAGSPISRQQGKAYSVGPAADVVSFHCYEGLETAFSHEDRTIERDFSDIRALFEKWEHSTPEFSYVRKEEYWQTEGNYDFFGVMSANRRAAWRMQFLTRGFAAGIRKLMVMDASVPEQAAVRAYIRALPNPFPMLPVTNEVSILIGQPVVFRHPDGADAAVAGVWVVWAKSGTGPATVEIPVIHQRLELVTVDGNSKVCSPVQGRLRLELKGDSNMAPPLLLIDRLLDAK